MKKEVILVPKDKFPIDVIAEIGERTKNCWIFLHDNAYLRLKNACDKDLSTSYYKEFFFESSNDSPETHITFHNCRNGDWFKVISISAYDLDVKCSEDPEDIFFIRMEE